MPYAQDSEVYLCVCIHFFSFPPAPANADRFKRVIASFLLKEIRVSACLIQRDHRTTMRPA